MCILSNKLKFCTCVSGSPKKLKHYWELHRFAKGKNECIMGIPAFPTCMMDDNFSVNKSTLLSRLNEPDAFDKPIRPNAGDNLNVIINNTSPSRFTYSFVFRGGNWQPTEFDYFNQVNHFNRDKSGKIKSALKRTKP